MPTYRSDIIAVLRKEWRNLEWHVIYDRIESILSMLIGWQRDEYSDLLNDIFESNLAPYRVVEGLVLEVDADTDAQTIVAAIEETHAMPGAKHHLERALDLLANRSQPDYPNAIKEAISAVESTAKEITGESNASLAQALKALESKGVHIQGALRDGWLKFYGYTSQASGIRHAASEKPNVTQADARYWLVTCSAFVSLLLKMDLEAKSSQAESSASG